MPGIKPVGLHQGEIVTGPICPFLAHSISSLDGRVPRYSDTQACVQCVDELTSRTCTLDVHRIHPQWRRSFLEFWSLVQIRDPAECWIWHGTRRNDDRNAYCSLTRHWSKNRTWGPSRVAFWFTWGDIARVPIRQVCGNPSCCNPLHLKAKGITHYYLNQRLQLMNLEFSSRELAAQTAAFLRCSRGGNTKQRNAFNRRNEDWIRRRLACETVSGALVDQVQSWVNDTSVDLLEEHPAVVEPFS